MKSFCLFLFSSVLCCVPLALSGCSASFSPDTSPSPALAVVNGPSISGSVYGGHAPLVGAKVYVLSPSTTANAGLSTSLMNSTSSTTGGYPVAKDTSGGVTNGMYYVTTDAFGIFDLTGDYTCTVNQPVYIAAVGGSPTFPNTTGAVGITGVTEVSTTGTGAAQTGTLTFTSASTELFYPGELVTLTGFTGDLAYLNNSVQTVLPNNLTTTQFEATLGTWNGTKDINAAYTGLSGRAAATPPQNPAAVNMAALGLCPPSGNFAGTISFIYMNEISTVSLAYATAAFGSDAFHIGIKAGGPARSRRPQRRHRLRHRQSGTGLQQRKPALRHHRWQRLHDLRRRRSHRPPDNPRRQRHSPPKPSRLARQHPRLLRRLRQLQLHHLACLQHPLQHCHTRRKDNWDQAHRHRRCCLQHRPLSRGHLEHLFCLDHLQSTHGQRPLRTGHGHSSQ